MASLSVYEASAIAEIDRFKNPVASEARSTLRRWTRPVGDVVGRLLGAGAATRVAVLAATAGKSALARCNDAAAWTVRHEAIYRDFRRRGLDVVSLEDIRGLELESVDRAARGLGAKYSVAAGVEGAALGVLGAPGVVGDLPALLAIALRAVNEYAAYYGFDVGSQRERMFVLHVLLATSVSHGPTRQSALLELAGVAASIARGQPWDEDDERGFSQLTEMVAMSIAVRWAKTKLAQVVPVVGGAIGGGFNAWYLADLSQLAYHAYRERFLVAKYGGDVGVEVRG